MIKIKNAAQIAKKSKKGMKLFYDYEKQTLNTTGNTGHFVTELLRECTTKEIQEAVFRWSML